MNEKKVSSGTILDQAAWERFLVLVAEGAGKADTCAGIGLQPTPADIRYVEELVEHHRVNAIPFLIERCGLRGKEVIEIGAGTGGLSVAMIEAGARSVTAVEPIALNQEAGRMRARAHGMAEQIGFHHIEDTDQLPFDAGAFDLAVLSSMLQYVPAPERRRALLREACRLLRPNGILAVCGSGNGLLPVGAHSTRWWSNLLPRRAAQARARLSGVMVAGYRLLESIACPVFGWPIEAFMPFPALAFEKAGV